MAEAEIHIVFRRENPTTLTKKCYRDWREIQDEFDDYVTSLGPWTVSEVIDFWKTEYPTDYPSIISNELKLTEIRLSEAEKRKGTTTAPAQMQTERL
jgi:hypothetical protein